MVWRLYMGLVVINESRVFSIGIPFSNITGCALFSSIPGKIIENHNLYRLTGFPPVNALRFPALVLFTSRTWRFVFIKTFHQHATRFFHFILGSTIRFKAWNRRSSTFCSISALCLQVWFPFTTSLLWWIASTSMLRSFTDWTILHRFCCYCTCLLHPLHHLTWMIVWKSHFLGWFFRGPANDFGLQGDVLTDIAGPASGTRKW